MNKKQKQTIYLLILLMIISAAPVLAIYDTVTPNVVANGNIATNGNIAITGNEAVTTGNVAVVTETSIPIVPIETTAVPTPKSPGFTAILAAIVVVYMMKRKK